MVKRLSASHVAKAGRTSPARGYQLGVDLSFAADLRRLCTVDSISEPFLEGGRATTRFQTPKDIGEMAAFLASDRAENITGAAFNVDGG